MGGKRAQLWILLHRHRHGMDVFTVEAESEADLPAPADVAVEFDATDADEWTEWRGPFPGWVRTDEEAGDGR